MSIENLKAFDPFADAAKGDDEGVQVRSQRVLYLFSSLCKKFLCIGWSGSHKNPTEERSENANNCSGIDGNTIRVLSPCV